MQLNGREPLSIPPARWGYHKGGVYFTYRWRYNTWLNKYCGSQLWHCLDEWYVFIALQPKLRGWFATESLRYDGHTNKSITLFGLTIGHGYSYDSRAIDEQSE